MITAFALSTEGVPLGPVCQAMWRRPTKRATNRRPAKKRPVDKKETKHWVEAVATTKERMSPGHTPITYLVDREGDSAAMLCALLATKEEFIVRGNWDRMAEATDGRYTGKSSGGPTGTNTISRGLAKVRAAADAIAAFIAKDDDENG